MVVKMNVFKLEGFLFFFAEFPERCLQMKVAFSVGKSGDAKVVLSSKVVFFLAGSFSKFVKSLKLMG